MNNTVKFLVSLGILDYFNSAIDVLFQETHYPRSETICYLHPQMFEAVLIALHDLSPTNYSEEFVKSRNLTFDYEGIEIRKGYESDIIFTIRPEQNLDSVHTIRRYQIPMLPSKKPYERILPKI
jgi:hypothetical protein